MSDNILKTINMKPEQIETTIRNLAKARHLTKVEKIWEGKASFTNEAKQTIQEFGIHYTKVNKSAESYSIWKLTKPEDPKKSEVIKYNPTLKLHNYEDRIELVVVIQDSKFDKQQFLALPLIYNKIYPEIESCVKTHPENCYLNICTTYKIADKLATHLDEQILPINYRIISLVDLYPLIGSKTRSYSFTKNYEVCDYQPYYDGKQYMIIMDSDPMVKILNAFEGDVICCQILINDTCPYYEWQFRRVKSTISDNNLIDVSGLYLVNTDKVNK